MENAIESFEYYDYKPSITDNINDWGATYPIIAYNEDIITAPSRSLLIFQGEIQATDTSVTAGANNKVTDFERANIRIANNGILHMYDRIEYYLGDARIDDIQRPGIATTLKGFASFERDERYNDAGWYIQNSKSTSPVLDKKGHFYITIPLSIVMGFFEDYKQFIYRMPQKLVFYKNTLSSATNILIHDDKYDCTITLKEILWRIPQVKFNIVYDTKIKNEILKGVDYPLEYRHWRYLYKSAISGSKEFTWDFPVAYARAKYVLIGFQTNKENTKKADISQFDLCDLRSVQVQLNNNVYYPRERLLLNVSELKCGTLYTMFKNFKASYYNHEPDRVDPLINYSTFLEKYPIICIDCSNQPSVIKNSLINIKIQFEWGTTFPDNTVIHCVVISDDKSVYNPLYNKAVH